MSYSLLCFTERERIMNVKLDHCVIHVSD
jgi:hypothetical protein